MTLFRRAVRTVVCAAVAHLGLTLLLSPVSAAEADAVVMQPGEAFVTRFSGSTAAPAPAIDIDGVVGGIVDLRRPGQPAKGQHWLNEPQRAAIRARDVGQVFGVTLDNNNPPNIFVTATAAFGLHRTPDNSGWMPGMWGPAGGPGTIYKLSAESGYKPSVFADIRLEGRANTGAALGNIAFDKWNNQLLVSDLETGMIHRIGADDGRERGHYDHGRQGRAGFYDVESGATRSLPPVAFDPRSSAEVNGCKAGPFASTPACWNVADFRRRVWGLNVRQDAKTSEVRVYYAIWGSNGLGAAAFSAAADEEKRNWVWSVALNEKGEIDPSKVTREFSLPDFFTEAADLARHGPSQPVSDIKFPACGEAGAMLLSERGGLRNQGLAAKDAFAYPHQSRVLRYKAEDDDTWTPQGRYDVGFYDRRKEKEPRLRANASGGADFAHGYTTRGLIDTRQANAFVWMTGDALCSPMGPCFNATANKRIDGSEVHGLQGTPENLVAELVPEITPVAAGGDITPPVGPRESYMIDTDINVDAGNTPIMDQLTRDDSTRIGSLAVHQSCGAVEEAATGDLAAPAPSMAGMSGEPIAPTPEGDTTPGGAPPDIEIVKTGPAQCVAGDICSFTIIARSNGPGIWSGPLLTHDTLPPGATLANFSPQAEWQCTDVGGAVDCEHSAVSLAPGQSLTLVIDILVPPDMVGAQENCAETRWAPQGADDSPEVILAVEQRLAMLGFDPGPVDGVIDDQTAAAITAYEAANGLEQDGVISDGLREVMFPDDAGLNGDANPLDDRACAPFEVIQPEPVVGPAVGDALVNPLPPPVFDPPPLADPPLIDTMIPLFTPPPPCPPDTWRRRGECIPIVDVISVRSCPPPLVLHHGRCQCPNGLWPRHGRCVDIVDKHCPPGMIMTHHGCRCPSGMLPRHGSCQSIGERCRPPLVRIHDRCMCPDGRPPHHGQCGARNVDCKRPLVPRGGRCVCPNGAIPHHGQCGATPTKCHPPMVLKGGHCVCPAGMHAHNGRCTRTEVCRPPMVMRHGTCVKPHVHTCPGGHVWKNGHCVSSIVCSPGTILRNGKCTKLDTKGCPHGMIMRHGQCVKVDARSCPQGTHKVGATCVPDVKPTHCPQGSHLVGKTCVPNLAPTTTHCAAGTHLVGKVCVPDRVVTPVTPTTKSCPAGSHMVGKTCVPNLKPTTTNCAAGTHLVGKVCVPNKVVTPVTPTTKSCPAGSHMVGKTCVPNVAPTTTHCAAGTHLVGKVCVPNKVVTPVKPTVKVCPKGTHAIGQTCVPDLKPTVKPVTPTVKPTKPVVKVVPKPVVKVVPKPVVKVVPKPVVKVVPKPVVKVVPKPVVKVVPKPVVKAAPKPVIKVAPKPVIKVAPKPVSCPPGTVRAGNGCVKRK
jgi:hypothetical protein